MNLQNDIKNDPELASMMDEMIPNLENELQDPRGGILDESPIGGTWHHHQDPGRMQLVPTSQHQAWSKIFYPGQRGGYAIWGK
jgi:hypothetical protein